MREHYIPQIKLISASNIGELENKVNTFLDDYEENEIIDIQYHTNILQEPQITRHSAMIVYKH